MSNAVSNSHEVRAVFIPIESQQLLLPNAAVAEVIGYREPTSFHDAPEWLLGGMEWRNKSIPVVSFEQMLEIPEGEPGARARIAVCNTLNGADDIPFIGIVAKSIPRLVRVKNDNILSVDEESDLGPLVLEQVIASGERALIPDLDRLEQMVREVVA